MRRSLKSNGVAYRLALPWTIILMRHCLPVHSSFTVDDSWRANPCKLAFNGIRRNDPASSRYLSSCSLSSPFSSSDHGGEACAIDRFLVPEAPESSESRHDVNSWLSREDRSISVSQGAERHAGGQGRKVDREIANEGTNEKSERDDLIIGQACTLTYFRESIVKGVEKPESRQRRRKGDRGDVGRGRGRAWKRRPRSKFRRAPSGRGSCGNASTNRH